MDIPTQYRNVIFRDENFSFRKHGLYIFNNFHKSGGYIQLTTLNLDWNSHGFLPDKSEFIYIDELSLFYILPSFRKYCPGLNVWDEQNPIKFEGMRKICAEIEDFAVCFQQCKNDADNQRVLLNYYGDYYKNPNEYRREWFIKNKKPLLRFIRAFIWYANQRMDALDNEFAFWNLYGS